MKKRLKKTTTWSSGWTPDEFETQEMCEKAVEEYNHLMKWIPDELKTQGIYDEGFEKGYHLIEWFPDKYKMKNMCESAFWKLLPLDQMDPRQIQNTRDVRRL